MRRRNTAAQLAVNINIIRINIVANAYFGSNRLATFVNRGGRNMRVFIDDARG